MTKWMRTAVLKKVVVGLAVLASATVASQSAVAAAAGEFYRVDRVLAHDTDVWRVWVPAGASVRVLVDGDGDTDLDLHVYSPSGHLLGVDDDDTDYCVARFRTFESGYIQIRIRNWGRVYNEYALSVTF